MSSVGDDSHSANILYSLSPEEIDMLRDAFIYMDRDNDGHVNRAELLTMVHRCVGDERFGPLEEYLNPLFDVADKDKDNRLSLSEFLLSFADGPGVVPAEVINSCVSSVRVRLTDEEIETLQDTFRRIDKNEDGYIDKEELVAALKENLQERFPDLQNDNYNDIVAVIMASADSDRDGRLCLSEFIRSFQEDQGVLPAAFVDAGSRQFVRQLTPAEVEVLNEAFAVLDKDHDGYVDSADIYSALWETLSNSVQDKSQIRELCDLIMVTADRDKSGILTLADFVRGFVRNITLVQIPVAAAQEKMLKACDKLQDMLQSGELEQLSAVNGDSDENSTCVNPNQLVSVLSDVFRDVFPQVNEETLFSVIGAIVVASDNEVDKKLSLEDFLQCFAEGPRLLSPDSVSPQEPIVLTSEEMQVVLKVFQELGKDANSDGCVQEPEVVEAIRNAFCSNPKQVERVLQYLRENVMRRNLGSSLTVENTSQEESLGAEQASAVNRVATATNTETIPKVQTSSPSSQAVEVFNSAKHDNGTPTSIAPASGSISVALRKFGTNATVSDVLIKQHARRYLDAVYETADKAIFEDELRAEFRKYANGNEEYIDRDKFVKAYLSMEHYGLTPSERDVNRLISRYCTGDRVAYNEFCIIMLQRARM